MERAAAALGPLLGEVTFVGGATLGLWIDDPGAAPVRITLDVDAVVEITSRAALHDFDARLRAQGFREDVASGVICRWVHAGGELEEPLILDLMPTEAKLLGFANQWQSAAAAAATRRRLPSGVIVRAAPPAYLIAMKLEAFDGRGMGDHLLSHDLEDVVALVDGRAGVVDEVRSAPDGVRAYVAERTGRLLGTPAFLDALPGHLRPDVASQARRDVVVLPRLRELAALG
jgi:hypothetical protein